MVSNHPIICGYGLQNTQKKLVEYWLCQSENVRIHSQMPPPGNMGDHIHYIENVELGNLTNLLNWGYPVLLLKNQNQNNDLQQDFFTNIFEIGVSAIWEIPSHNQPVVFPIINMPNRKGEIIITTDDPTLRQHYRQISTFAGYDSRCDFVAAQDLVLYLDNCVPERTTKHPENFPDLIIVDLDSKKINSQLLFNKLSALLQKNFHVKNKLKIIITKDFKNPGLDIRSIDQMIRPFARRIFHPLESLSVLLESFYLSKENSINQTKKNHILNNGTLHEFRSLRDLLYGQQTSLSFTLPRFLPDDNIDMEVASGIEPFQWLHRHIEASNDQGLVLTTQSK